MSSERRLSVLPTVASPLHIALTFIAYRVTYASFSITKFKYAARVYKITFLFDCLSNCHEMGADPIERLSLVPLVWKAQHGVPRICKRDSPLAKEKDISFDPSSLLSCLTSPPRGWVGRVASPSKNSTTNPSHPPLMV